MMDGDYILPCDVRVPPRTTIRKGCKLSTLLEALRAREGRLPDLTMFADRTPPEQVSQPDAGEQERG